jgi:hypothetical protein
VNTCYNFLESGQIRRNDLELVLASLFHSDCRLDDVLAEEGIGAVRSLLECEYRDTGLSYFRPAAGLKG